MIEGADQPHLVASYTEAAALAAGDDVVIVGVDKRYAQLVTEKVWRYDANKDARYTPKVVKKRFGAAAPQVGDWLALVGDDDQMPGVTGDDPSRSQRDRRGGPPVRCGRRSPGVQGAHRRGQ